MSAAGPTLCRLHNTNAIGTALREVHQQGVVSLYVPCAQYPQAALPVDALPVGIARVEQLDLQCHTMALTVAAPVMALPDHVVAITHLAGGVRVQFDVHGQWQSYDGKQWQLNTHWPQEVLQLQRRRHPRLGVPVGQNYSASFSFGRKRCILDIEDLSIGGVALRGSRQETAMLFMGRVLPQVVLTMADGTQLQASLKVRARRSYRSFLLGEQVLVGCSVEVMDEADRAKLEALLATGIHTLLA